MFVLLGSVATELRWGGRHNNTFTRHEFLVVTVKEWLKSVYFYQSYRRNNSGVPLILDHPACRYSIGSCRFRWPWVILEGVTRGTQFFRRYPSRPNFEFCEYPYLSPHPFEVEQPKSTIPTSWASAHQKSWDPLLMHTQFELKRTNSVC